MSTFVDNWNRANQSSARRSAGIGTRTSSQRRRAQPQPQQTPLETDIKPLRQQSAGLPTENAVGSSVETVNSHPVVKGDTLWAIANANNTSVEELLRLNPTIKDVRSLQVGQNVRLPGGQGGAGGAGGAGGGLGASVGADGQTRSEPLPTDQRAETQQTEGEREGGLGGVVGPDGQLRSTPLDSAGGGQDMLDDIGEGYTVRVAEGENLSIIANRAGVSLQALKDANPHLSGNFNVIQPGDLVNIPGTTSVTNVTGGDTMPSVDIERPPIGRGGTGSTGGTGAGGANNDIQAKKDAIVNQLFDLTAQVIAKLAEQEAQLREYEQRAQETLNTKPDTTDLQIGDTNSVRSSREDIADAREHLTDLMRRKKNIYRDVRERTGGRASETYVSIIAEREMVNLNDEIAQAQSNLNTLSQNHALLLKEIEIDIERTGMKYRGLEDVGDSKYAIFADGLGNLYRKRLGPADAKQEGKNAKYIEGADGFIHIVYPDGTSVVTDVKYKPTATSSANTGTWSCKNDPIRGVRVCTNNKTLETRETPLEDPSTSANVPSFPAPLFDNLTAGWGDTGPGPFSGTRSDFEKRIDELLQANEQAFIDAGIIEDGDDIGYGTFRDVNQEELGLLRTFMNKAWDDYHRNKFQTTATLRKLAEDGRKNYNLFASALGLDPIP